MDQLQSIEGTWEDLIKNHSEELAGHRVKVTILPEKSLEPLDTALADLLAEADALEIQSPDLSGLNENAFGDELIRKYRKQGFDL